MCLDCHCLSLYVSTFGIPSCLPLKMYITVFISMIIAALTFLAKATVSMHGNLVLNIFFAFHLASSITLSFNPKGSIPVINITKGSIWFCKSFFPMNIKGWWFKSFTNIFLKKILNAERINLWALNCRPSTLDRVTSQNSLALIFIWTWQKCLWNWSILGFVCHNC